jgi:hypothetical protein
MNPIERLRDDLAARLPGLAIEILSPARAEGYWHMNVRRGDDYLMSVEWRPMQGFGFSTPKPDDLWSGHDEVAEDYDQALARIAHLLATGGETVPPLDIRLAELR